VCLTLAASNTDIHKHLCIAILAHPTMDGDKQRKQTTISADRKWSKLPVREYRPSCCFCRRSPGFPNNREQQQQHNSIVSPMFVTRVASRGVAARSMAVIRPSMGRSFSDEAEMDPKAIQAIVDAKIFKANQTGTKQCTLCSLTLLFLFCFCFTK
jgi:hypothetical protein